MELTFEKGAEKLMVEAFGLSIDDDDYVINEDGNRLKDGYGTPVKREDIGGIIPLDHHGFSVNEEGIVINYEKEPVAFTTEKGTADKRDSIVPFVTDDGEEAGIVRDNFSCVSDFVEESVSEEHTSQHTL